MRWRGIGSLRPAWATETPITKPSRAKVNSSGFDCRSKPISFCWTLIFQTSGKHENPAFIRICGRCLFWLGYRTSEGSLRRGQENHTEKIQRWRLHISLLLTMVVQGAGVVEWGERRQQGWLLYWSGWGLFPFSYNLLCYNLFQFIQVWCQPH